MGPALHEAMCNSHFKQQISKRMPYYFVHYRALYIFLKSTLEWGAHILQTWSFRCKNIQCCCRADVSCARNTKEFCNIESAANTSQLGQETDRKKKVIKRQGSLLYPVKNLSCERIVLSIKKLRLLNVK